MMKSLSSMIVQINEMIWTPLYVIVALCGLYFTLKLKGLQFTHFGKVINFLTGKDRTTERNPNEVAFSPLQAVATSISGSVGTGTIVGIASAVLTGGPGAVFWIWVIGLIGMIIKYVEIVLSMKHRVRNEKNEICGGPMFYISKGLNSKFLAIAYSLALIFASLVSGNIVQINSIANISKSVFPGPNVELIVGIVLAILFIFIILGGTKGIAKISEIMAPIFCGGYIIFALAVILSHYKNIPTVFSLIFTDAFTLQSAAGGAMGYSLMTAVRYGLSRGISAAEIGIGTGAIAHGASSEKDPYKEGLLGIFEVFISCFVVCTFTALVLLLCDPSIPARYGEAIASGGLGALEHMDNSLTLLTKSFATILGGGANIFMWVCIFLFAYTTVIGFYFYGVRAYEYIFGVKTGIIFKIVFIVAILIAPMLTGGLVWQLNDLATALMLVINLVAVILLRKKIFKKD